jgi:hypothetical protein
MDKKTRLAVARRALRLANEAAEHARTEAGRANRLVTITARRAHDARQVLADAELTR